jgi:peptidoglycan/xylan/chitin deacetylase (PgdA/CDA1 family)
MIASELPPFALAYHGVADIPLRRDPVGLFVRPRDLRRQIDRLRSWGYRFVRFGELVELVVRDQAGGAVSLTFDDGLVDNLEELVPILAAEEISATVFVVAGWLGKPYPWAPWTRILNASEVRALHDEGVEIGSHTLHHVDLTTLSHEGAREELEASRLRLEELIAATVGSVAYPFGAVNDDTIDACRDAGFAGGCRTSGNGGWDDPLNLPRQDMDNRCSMLGFRLKRDDRYERLMRLAPARATRRLSRRIRAVTG